MKTYAFYLPQFHPCKANDDFWEEGFTDWVTTYNSKPLYDGHFQPLESTQLGKYDLTEPEVIRKQAALAREHGVNGFAIYHYWFGKGDRALETPIEIIRNNKDIDIDYFISWVNCNWTKSWVGDHETVIREQKYDDEFYDELIDDSLLHFKEERYVKIKGSPVFYIHSPKSFDVEFFIKKFESKAKDAGFSRIIWLAPEIHTSSQQAILFDYLCGFPPGDSSSIAKKIKFAVWDIIDKVFPKLQRSPALFKLFRVLDYKKYVERYIVHVENKLIRDPKYIPTLMHSWDNSPRYKYKSFSYSNATPEENYNLYSGVFSSMHEHKRPFALVKAWNEWAEGNVLEPCSAYGDARLKAFSKAKVEIGNGEH